MTRAARPVSGSVHVPSTPDRAALLDEHPLDRAAHDYVGARVEGVLQVGPLRAELRSGLVAEADVGRRGGVVAALVGVAQDRLERPPEPVRAFLHPLVRAVEVRAAVVDVQALEDRVEVAVEVRAVHPFEAVLGGPLLPHPRAGAQAVGPVDDRPAAEARPGVDRHVEVGRRLRPAPPVHVLVGGQLELVEVGLVEVPGRLHHADLQTGLGQRAGDHPATRSGADDAHVGLQLQLVVLRHDRLDRLGARRGRSCRSGVAEHLPIRVLAGLRVGGAVSDEEREADQCRHARRRLGARQRHVFQDLLARGLRQPRDAELLETVEQFHHPRELIFRQHREDLLDALVGAHVGRAAAPQTGRVGLTRNAGHDGVAHRPQDGAPGFGQLTHPPLLSCSGTPSPPPGPRTASGRHRL